MLFASISYALKKGIDYVIYSNDTRTIDNGNPVYWDNLLVPLKSKTAKELDMSLPLYQEPNFSYDPIPENIDVSFNIRGYFQSYKYFQENYDKIYELTGIKSKREEVKNKYSYVYNKKCIAIHFRIGDYIGLQANHPIMPIEYYENSLKYLESKLNLNDYNILYFCQKIDNERVIKLIETLNATRNYTFFKVPDDVPDWNQLLMISLCNHCIIANSTFSWWGAYINDNPEKIVSYPAIWFGPNLKHNNTKDLCPSEWVKIEW
jgi:hypothetical protein